MAGNAYGGVDSPKLTYRGTLRMWAGSNKISILSAAVGLPVCLVSHLFLFHQNSKFGQM